MNNVNADFFTLSLVNLISLECLSASRCHSKAGDQFPNMDQIEESSCGGPYFFLEMLMAVCLVLPLFSLIRTAYAVNN